jgi:hypothetical protein
MLCSRAITRERAAMSGSIAAFILTGFFILLPSRSGSYRSRLLTPLRHR